jgi:hypothetical protein
MFTFNVEILELNSSTALKNAITFFTRVRAKIQIDLSRPLERLLKNICSYCL